MIERNDRILNPDECEDLMQAYAESLYRKYTTCKESIHDGKLILLVEVPLTSPLPRHIILSPRDSFIRITNTIKSIKPRTSKLEGDE